MKLALKLAESGLLPDFILRAGIRHLSEVRLKEITANSCQIGATNETAFISAMNKSDVAPVPELANAQHYEVPEQFFHYCLGINRKYSSCYWDKSTKTLDQAENLALNLTCQHADLQDGQTVLEMGCGWGSLSLWMAIHYPNSHITGVSNSNSQREYIMAQAKLRGLDNLNIMTCDMNIFQAPQKYDRIVSVEMFEHMRNWHNLYSRVHDWLKPGGKFFKHIFVHRLIPYAFDVRGEDDWMSEHFFSGGMMPSDDLPLRFQDKLKLLNLWRWDGTHYEKTANAWLENMDIHQAEITPILAATYGDKNVEMWRNRWRIFYLACAELFGLKNGQEWWVSHYLFERPL